MPYFFVRVNGDTAHNDPSEPKCYVKGEPPHFPATYFNYYQYCLDNNIVRIGWPDVGDIIAGNKTKALKNCYDMNNIPTHIKDYLSSFSKIPLKSNILMPNKDHPGELYLGEVIKTYLYYHNVPQHPYECSHRVGVKWDHDINGNPIIYRASQLGINIIGGWWRRAFYEIRDITLMSNIDNARRSNGF